MDLHYRQEVTVGALVLTGAALFIAGTMWLSGRSLGPAGNTVRVQFADVGNLKEGNPVKVSGVSLGNVEGIRFEEVGRVVVTLSLDRRIVPRLDAAARLTSVGIVGDVVIDFDPGQAAEPLPPDRVIIGSQAEGLAALGTELSDRARVVLDGLAEVANKRMADDLHNTLVSIQRLSDVFANERSGPTAELTATMSSLRQLSTRLDSVLASPALDRALGSLDSATAQLGRMTDQFTTTGAQLDSVLVRINRGEGTLGRLASDTTFYAELRDLSASIRQFVDDLRAHPGKLSIQVRIF
jgi:phospholipid/cholesterol/gamma-HCH transport system substrate-binding protein